MSGIRRDDRSKGRLDVLERCLLWVWCASVGQKMSPEEKKNFAVTKKVMRSSNVMSLNSVTMVLCLCYKSFVGR